MTGYRSILIDNKLINVSMAYIFAIVYLHCKLSHKTFHRVHLWPWECFMYSASHARPTYQFS